MCFCRPMPSTPFAKFLIPRAALDYAEYPRGCEAARCRQAASESEMRAQAEALMKFGCGAVLLKGGHVAGQEASMFYSTEGASCIAPAAHRDAKYARNGLHVVGRDSGKPRARVDRCRTQSPTQSSSSGMRLIAGAGCRSAAATVRSIIILRCQKTVTSPIACDVLAAMRQGLLRASICSSTRMSM